MCELEEHFSGMDVARKLEKRRGELTELRSICQDFDDKLGGMRSQLESDITKIVERRSLQSVMQKETGTLMDEEGRPVDILEELSQVQSEL